MQRFNTGNRILRLLALVGLLAASAARAESLPDFTGLVEENSAAVVNISTTQKVKAGMPELPPGMEIPEGPWGDLFRHFFGEGGPGGSEEYDAKSLGSGFIVSRDGYVITNNHVVREADKIIVRLSDRRELKAEIVGADERSDIALLKVESDDLPVIKIGRSADLKVGEWVLAIGTPFGFDHSVTAGIVSALGRSLPSENYVPFIQTDVAINPGNSGGPLFNMRGEVVGVNSQIYSRTGGYMGLSFAIPIDVAMDVVEQLKETGHVSRGWLGVLIQNVTRELAESFGMDQPQGALVAQVVPGGPAERGGIRVGDVIVEFDGKPVPDSASLPPLVGRTKAGAEVPVKVVRDGKTRTLHLEIGELPEEEEGKPAAPRPTKADRLGLEVEDPSAEQRKELEVEDHGVLVREVKDGPAGKAGVRRGDVILMLDNVKVRDAEHFGELVGGLEAGKSVALLVQRQGGALFLALRVPEE